MNITILYDNTTSNSDLVADWGFSCLVKVRDRNILFDTGANGKILFQNLQTLNINPQIFTDIVISHPDFDHIGGLSTILNLNEKAVIHNPISFRGIRYANEVKYYREPTEIYHKIFLTGELGNREQSLAVSTQKGLVIIIGCGHPGVESIINSLLEFDDIINSLSGFGKIHAIVGGLHGFDQYEVLENVDKVCATHCTQNKDKIKSLFPGKFIKGGVGRTIEF